MLTIIILFYLDYITYMYRVIIIIILYLITIRFNLVPKNSIKVYRIHKYIYYNIVHRVRANQRKTGR